MVREHRNSHPERGKNDSRSRNARNYHSDTHRHHQSDRSPPPPRKRRGSPRRSPPKKKPSPKHIELYNILGVSPNASSEEIRKAYKKLAVQYHPDKNRDSSTLERFNEIKRSYEILSDSKKRKEYDMGGMEALEELEEKMEEHRHHHHHEEEEPKADDVTAHLLVSLETIYKGGTVSLKVRKELLCDECGGRGHKPGVRPAPCRRCDGQGVERVQQMLFIFMQDAVIPCQLCNGDGVVIAPRDMCRHCAGDRVLSKECVCEIVIPKGLKEGGQVIKKGEGSQSVDIENGDLIVIVTTEDHPVFERNGNNLHVKTKISLLEALTGFQIPIRHLDGRLLLVKPPCGKIIRNGDQMMIPNEGMPHQENPLLKGSLIITFEVEFPNSLNTENIKLLRDALPPDTEPELPADQEVEECIVQDYDISKMKPKEDHHETRDIYDGSDSEDGGHPFGGGGGGGDDMDMCLLM